MDDFSSIYEKLSDMGFTSSAIDSAIEIGLYTFDDIFNALVDKELSSSRLDHGQTTLRESRDKTEDFVGAVIDNENNCPRQKQSDGDTLTLEDRDCGSTVLASRRSESRDPQRLDVVTNYSRMPSSSVASSVLSNNSLDSSARSMSKIQIMDLLDPSYQPQTYSQPFLSNMCSIRDIICWFCQCRSSKVKSLVTSNIACNSRVAITIDTDMHSLIGLFEDLKWHLVLPSGANSLRIYGKDNLDKYLDELGLVPNAHLLAIVGCPLQLRLDKAHSLPSTSSYSSSITNNSSTKNDNVTAEFCYVHIRMINYRNNPLYLHGRSSFKEKYNIDTTTMQTVVNDFSRFCECDLSSFVFLQMNPSKVLSYPDDYLRSLRELSFVGNVTLYCHLRSPVSSSSSALGTTTNPGVPNSRIMSFTTWDPETHTAEYSNNSNDLRNNSIVFPGHGRVLEGVVSRKSVQEIWDDKSLVISVPGTESATDRSKQQTKAHKSLFRLCLSVLYRCVKEYYWPVCRQVRRLPNTLQQILIRALLEDQCLSPTTLGHFCTSKSCLASLDLSYTPQATNEVLRSISKCINLQELILDNEDHVFTNEGLWFLRTCINLRRLSLNYCCRINDWGIQVVTQLPRLSVLSVKHTAVSDVGLARIFASLTSPPPPHILASPHSSSSPSTPPFPVTLPLALHPPLTSIDLSGLGLTDQSLACLALFPGLQLLNLASTAISDPAALPFLPQLQHLDLSHCPQLVWDRQSHIRALNDCFPCLTSIAVRDTANHNLVFLTNAIALCLNLRQIDGLLCHPQMTASLLSSIAHLPLDSIVLTNCSHVTDLWLPVIARFSTTLSHFVLSSCHSVTGTNQSLLNHLSRLSNLSWLDLTHLESVLDSTQIIQLVLGPYFHRMQVVWFSLTEEEEFHFRSQTRDTSFKINITRSLHPHNIDL